MIHAFQMHQLVDQHVIADEGRHVDETPIQRDVSLAGTRAPSSALIANADAGDVQTVLGGKLQKANGQLAPRARQACGIGWRWSRHLPVDGFAAKPRPLTFNPQRLPAGKVGRFTLRTAAWDRDPYGAVVTNAQHVASRLRMPHEHDRVGRGAALVPGSVGRTRRRRCLDGPVVSCYDVGPQAPAPGTSHSAGITRRGIPAAVRKL
jgi:hypothetical protein